MATRKAKAAIKLPAYKQGKVAWQPPTVRAAAVRLLAVRPIVNCNWNAHKGETLADLEVENRWLLDEPSVERNGLVVPRGLDVPEAVQEMLIGTVALYILGSHGKEAIVAKAELAATTASAQIVTPADAAAALADKPVTP